MTELPKVLVLLVQVIPSVEVLKFQPKTPATYTPLPKVRAFIADTPKVLVLLVQVVPFVELLKVPLAPPATYTVP
jgi:hypothetical protein